MFYFKNYMRLSPLHTFPKRHISSALMDTCTLPPAQRKRMQLYPLSLPVFFLSATPSRAVRKILSNMKPVCKAKKLGAGDLVHATGKSLPNTYTNTNAERIVQYSDMTPDH